MPKADVQAKIRTEGAAMGLLEFAKKLPNGEAPGLRGLGFGDYGDNAHVRFLALIENRDQIHRQGDL